MKKSMDLDTVRTVVISSKNVAKQLLVSSVGNVGFVLQAQPDHD